MKTHDKDAINRFLKCALNHKAPAHQDAEAAAWLIVRAIQSSPQFRQMLGIRKGRGPKHDMEKVCLDNPVFTIALSLALGECTRDKAIEAMCQHYNDIDEKTAAEYLAQLESRAKATAEGFAMLRAWGGATGKITRG